MNDRLKRVLFGIGFVVVSISIGYGLYFLFFKPAVQPIAEVTPTEQLGGSLPSAGTGGPSGTVVTGGTGGGLTPSPDIAPTEQPIAPTIQSHLTLLRDGVTQALTPSADNKGARFYNPEDGRFYRVNPDGTLSLLADKQFFNVQNVSWANRDERAVLEFPDGSNVMYDFAAKRQVTLPKHWDSFKFSPDDEQMVAKSIGLDQSNRYLIVTDPNGGEAKALEPLGDNAGLTTVSWSPNNQVIAFAETGRPQPDGAREIFLVGQNHENYKSLIVPGRGFLPNWSPTGRSILYSIYHERDGLRPSLWVSGGVGDSIGENRRALNLQTWADKCAWQDETVLICGVPQHLDVGAGLSRQSFSDVPDDIYRIDLRNGEATKVSDVSQVHPIRQPLFNSDKTKLLFTDAVTGRLYSYDLP